MTTQCECHNWDRNMGEGRAVKLVYCGDGEYHHPACAKFEEKWHKFVNQQLDEKNKLNMLNWRFANLLERSKEFMACAYNMEAKRKRFWTIVGLPFKVVFFPFIILSKAIKYVSKIVAQTEVFIGKEDWKEDCLEDMERTLRDIQTDIGK